MKNAVFAISAILILFLITSCDESSSDVEIIQPADPINAGAVVHNFGIKLYKASAASTEEENICISPLSVATALSMTYNGARGNTRVDMAEVLGYPEAEDAAVNAGFKQLEQELETIEGNSQFEEVNGLFWDEARINMDVDFLERMNGSFGVHTEQLDFGQSVQSKDQINDWVASNTRDKIKDLLQTVKPLDVLFLINALYFQADWVNGFSELSTTKWPFIKDEGTEVMVDMMIKDAEHNAYLGNDFKAVDLDLGEGGYSMTILVPMNEKPIQDFALSLTPALLDDLYQSKLKFQRIFLRLPRFDLTYRANLNEVLTAMGMGIAFDEGSADLTGLGQPFSGRLFIDRVIHKTRLIVDENGVEGAAATVVGIAITSAPPTISFDRSFIYIIRDKATSAILFIGHVGNPT